MLAGLLLVVSTGCFGSRGFPSVGNLRVRVINEGTDPATDITITHGSQSLYVAELGPGRRTASMMPIDQDADIVVSYFHPNVGTERETYSFRARERDAGYVEIRFDRAGFLDVRSRFRLTETR